MDSEEAVQIADTAVFAKTNKHLNNVQRFILLGSFEQETYEEIAEINGYSAGYLQKDAGPGLWRLLTDVLSENINKKNFRAVMERRSHNVLSVEPYNPFDTSQPLPIAPLQDVSSELSEEDDRFWTHPNQRQDWVTPDVSVFYGRDRELEQLDEMIRIRGCRLLTLFGVGGVGKTALAVRLSQRVWDQFEVRIWRSIDAHPLPELVSDLVSFFSGERKCSADLSQLPQLLHYLVQHRCLIVLDGFESVLQSGVHDGSYQTGFAEYGNFLRQVSRMHQSCIIVTSREEPKETLHSYRVTGLKEISGRELIESKGRYFGSEDDWRTLTRHYEGNPFALHDVATRILRDLFGSNIPLLLEQLKQDTAWLGEVRVLFDQQFTRLSNLEQVVIECLTKQNEPATFQDILLDVTQPTAEDVLRSLVRRSLIEVKDGRYFLGRLVRRYAINRPTKLV